jgi:glycosyltransferase involved in cell wall biosynthesis
MNVDSVTILICTYNRAALLRETLAAMQAMTPPPDCRVEILIVDNNSTDDTAAAIAEHATGRFAVRPLVERKQGKSFALNAGLAQATGDVIALTDDDVLPSIDWLARIVAAFRERDVTFVFGKVLPRWETVPPPEILLGEARDIWGPLALVDYGDEPADYLATSAGQRLPIGANLSFARSALQTIGGWRNDLGKVNNTLISGEDHEVFMRLRRFELFAGYYDPANAVRHFVPASRLTRSYFRRWFFWHGRTSALMLDDLYGELDLTRVPFVLGLPRFLWRQVLHQVWCWLRTRPADGLTSLTEELRLVKCAGLISECWRRRRTRTPAFASSGALTARQ